MECFLLMNLREVKSVYGKGVLGELFPLLVKEWYERRDKVSETKNQTSLRCI